MAQENMARCDRCGDKITADGTKWRCVGCEVFTDVRGRKLHRQPNAAERMRRYRQRQLELELGKAFGPMTQVTQRRRPER